MGNEGNEYSEKRSLNKKSLQEGVKLPPNIKRKKPSPKWMRPDEDEKETEEWAKAKVKGRDNDEFRFTAEVNMKIKKTAKKTRKAKKKEKKKEKKLAKSISKKLKKRVYKEEGEEDDDVVVDGVLEESSDDKSQLETLEDAIRRVNSLVLYSLFSSMNVLSIWSLFVIMLAQTKGSARSCL